MSVKPLDHCHEVSVYCRDAFVTNDGQVVEVEPCDTRNSEPLVKTKDRFRAALRKIVLLQRFIRATNPSSKSDKPLDHVDIELDKDEKEDERNVKEEQIPIDRIQCSTDVGECRHEPDEVLASDKLLLQTIKAMSKTTREKLLQILLDSLSDVQQEAVIHSVL